MRLLDPSAFGLIGMITVFTGFLERIKDSGLGTSLIYHTSLTRTDKDTVFWFNIFSGLLLTGILFISSKLLADYYNEPILNELIKTFSITFIISALSITHKTLLIKKLDFKKIFQVEVVGLTLSAVLAIISAYLGFGVWSLIVLHLSRALMLSVTFWILSDYTPNIKFSFKILKKHFEYSFPVLGTQSLNYWTRNADNFFIGSLLGSEALGFYSRAYFFVTMPVQKISGIIGSVLFPSLSILKDNKNKAADLFLKSMKMTAFITFPLLGGVIVLTEPFVFNLFGIKWMPIISTLKILSVLALLQSVMTFTGSIFYSQGATRLNFKISVVYGIFNILIFYIGSLFSIEMVALLLLCGFILYVYPRLYFVSKLIDIGVIDILINLKHIFFVNSICMLISFIFFNLTFDDSRNLFSLVSGILIYLFLYIISNYMFNKKNSLEFVNNIRNVVKS